MYISDLTSDQLLRGRTVAILATDGFEQVELEEPRRAFERAGARTLVIAPKAGTIRGFHHHDKGDEITVDETLENVDPKEFDGLLLPGGTLNVDALRAVPRAVEFVRQFATTGRTIAAICHAPWTLVEADVVRGRKMTSWPSIKTDLINAGAVWVDDEVVVDHGLVTSRKPEDIPAFVERAIAEMASYRETHPASE